MTRRIFCGFVCLGSALAPAAQAPRPSPEYAFTLINGQKALLTNYKGKVIALEFLLTTCPHCQHASSIMEKLYKEFGPRGFQPIGVAINTDPLRPQQALAADYARQFRLTYPIGFASNDSAINYLQHPIMTRMLMPQLVFLDRNFIIQGQYAGDDQFFKEPGEEANMRAMVEKLLKSGPPAKKQVKPAARKKAS
jgi:thiol-disulfide isomerase/thioredoxin